MLFKRLTGERGWLGVFNGRMTFCMLRLLFSHVNFIDSHHQLIVKNINLVRGQCVFCRYLDVTIVILQGNSSKSTLCGFPNTPPFRSSGLNPSTILLGASSPNVITFVTWCASFVQVNCIVQWKFQCWCLPNVKCVIVNPFCYRHQFNLTIGFPFKV